MNYAVLAMAMVRLLTTSSWYLSIDTIYSTISELKKDCELILGSIFTEKNYKIHAMGIVDDHVYQFLEFHPSISLLEVIQYLKNLNHISQRKQGKEK